MTNVSGLLFYILQYRPTAVYMTILSQGPRYTKDAIKKLNIQKGNNWLFLKN